ncbi:MAG: anion permease [Lachnospiraceae bacterium]|nr:anion permease [Lachnospiraceae bacterium]
MSSIQIVIAITILMAILFMMPKVPFGLAAMFCCFLLVVTGVSDISEAFSGLSNQTVIMVASMFGLSAALQKTSLAFRLKDLIGIMSGKSDMALMITLSVLFIVMLLVLPGMVLMVMFASFLGALGDKSEVTPSRVILPMLMINVCWETCIPLGMGATQDFQANAYIENIVAAEQLLVYGDMFKVRIIPAILVVIYACWVWKKLPKRELNINDEMSSNIRRGDLAKWKEWLVYIVFICVVLVLVFNSYFGSLMYVIPGLGLVILGFAGVLSPKEITQNVCSDTIWMLAGIMGMTAALTNSGAADLIGNVMYSLVSWTDNGFVIMLIISLFTALMTTFLSNSGCRGVLLPLVAAMAVSAGMDPRGLVCCVSISAGYAFCFPTGSTTCAFAFALGEYNPAKVLKYTLPLLVILCVVTAICCNIVFPVYG